MADGSSQFAGSDTEPLSGKTVLLTYLLLTFAVVLFASATAFGFFKMRQQADMAQYNSQAALWLVVSFEREYLTLDSMLWRYSQQDSALDPEELLTQYDVLWSRIELMRAGEHSRPLKRVKSYDSAVPVALQLVQRHEQSVFEAVPAGRPLPDAFLRDFRAMAEPIHQYMIDTHLNRSWVAEVMENQIKDARLAMYLTLAGTLASTLLLFAIIILQLKGRQSNLLRTMRALEQSEADRNALHAEVERRQKVEKERKRLLRDLEVRNEDLEGYAYTISHDLKSPLYTIQGFTGFLERDLEQGDTQKMRQDLAKVRDAVTSMSTLLDDILDLSRVNLLQESAEQLALAEVVENAIQLVSRQIRETGVEVRIDPDLPEVYAAPQRLTEVYQNLISNATKFAGDQPQPLIEIGARRDGDLVYCHVRDNGIGIEPEYRERVFNLFERLDSSTEGTGVGLAIVKRIIESLGGTIWIQSDGPGSGASFEFTLPAKAAE